MAENRRPSQRYLSGRVKLTAKAGLGTDRHLYLSPSDAEPNLGYPGEKSVPISGTYYRLVTIPNGNTYDRYWQVDSPASLVDGISIFDEGTLVGTANSVSKINIVGSAITATASGSISTISVAPPGTDKQILFNDLDDFGAASQVFYDKANNRLGIGISNPTQQLHISNDFRIGGMIWDQHNQVGGAGSVLMATGAGVSWTRSAGANVTVSDTAPSGAVNGDLWWDSEDGDLNVYYEDVDSSAWVSANANADQEDGVWTLDAIGIHTLSNVGIGTTMASVALAVGGNAIFGGALGGTGIVTATEFHGNFIGNGIGMQGIGGTWASNTAGIHTTKNVGIGSTLPNALLDVRGNSSFTGLTTFRDDVTFKGDNHDILWDKSKSALILKDNTQINFGTDEDGDIYHDNAQMIINNATGALKVRSNEVILGSPNNERYFTGVVNAEAKLYWNDVQKFQTTGAGVSVYGGATTTGLSTFASIELDSTLVDIHGQVGAARSVLTATGAGVSWGRGGSGVKIDENPPIGNYDADLWWESDTGEMHIWYNDGTSAAWVSVSQGPAGVQGAQGAQGATGAQGVQGASGITTAISAGNSSIRFDGSSDIRFISNNNTRMYLDSDKFLVGAQSAWSHKAHYNDNNWSSDKFWVASPGGASQVASFGLFGNNAMPCEVAIQKTRGNVGSMSALQLSDPLGALQFNGSPDNSMRQAATFACYVDSSGTINNSSLPTNLRFYTNNNGAVIPTEKVRITSAGKVGIGTEIPSELLEIASSVGCGIAIKDDNNGFAASKIKVENGGRDLAIGAPQDIFFKDIDTGTKHLYIESTGHIGIGTDNPGKQLHVYKSNEHPLLLERGDSANTQVELRTGGVVRGYWGCSTTSNFMVYDNDTSDINFTVLQTGNVGIGIVNPTNKLEISGGLVRCLGSASARFTANNGSAEGFIGFNSGTFHIGEAAATTQIAAAGANIISMVTNSNERLRILSGGNVNINGNFTQTTYPVSITTGNVNKKISFGAAAHADLSNEGSGIFFSRQNDGSAELSGLFSHSNGGFGIATREDMTFHTGGGSTYGNAEERLRITSAGKVGIKNTSPSEMLQIGDGSGTTGGLKVAGQSSSVTDDGLTIDWTSSNEARLFSESSGDATMHFYTTSSGTRGERLRITSDGLVGINDSNPDNQLVVKSVSGHSTAKVTSGDETTSMVMQAIQGSEGRLGMNTNHPLAIYAGGLERVRITDNGLSGNIVEKWLDFGLTYYNGSSWVDNGSGQQNRNAPSVNSDNAVTRFVFATSPYHRDFQSCTFWFGEAGNVGGNVFDVDFTVYHNTAAGGYSSNSSTFTKDLNAFSNGKVDRIVFHDDMPTISANAMVQVNMDWTENTNGGTCHCHGILIREWTIPHS